MTSRIYAIALNTFREAIRNRVLYGILAVVFGLNLFAAVLGEMSLNQEARVARDVGLGGISLFGSVTAIVLGVSLLYAEIQRRTIHTIIAKPIERWEFVLGKYLGMAATLTLLVLVFAITMFVVLSVRSVPFDLALGKAVLLAYIEVLVVAAVAIFFSSFSSPYLSGIFTFGLFFAGRMTDEMRHAAQQSKNLIVTTVCDFALYVVPDLSMFAISGGSVDGKHVSIHTGHTGDFVSWTYVFNASTYGILYITALMVLAIIIFSRRDFL